MLRSGVAALSLVAAGVLAAGSAQATEGYFQTGYGAIQKAQAGTGVANPEDAMALSVNPAGLVAVGNQFNAAFTLFSPQRDVTAAAGGLVPAGKTESGNSLFLMPNMAYSRQIDGQSAWGVAIFGNGGMNTSYGNVANAACGAAPFAGAPGNVGSGVFCGGAAGVNLEQMFVTVGYARKMGDVSLGVAPVFALQKFRGEGMSMFGGMGASSDPGNMTNKGDDYAYGAGARVGLQWNLSPSFRVGLTGQTPIWSTKFGKYKGLYAEGGGFDIPANVSAGLAWDALPNLTLMLDYRHIFYGSVKAIGNTSTTLVPISGNMGFSNGPGFGWTDVDVVSVAAAYRVNPDLTLRFGYSHNTNPIRSADVMLNILAPGVVTDHLSTGFSYKFNKNHGLDFSFGYVPRHSVTGTDLLGFGQNLKISMEQYEASLGYSYKF